MKEPYNPKEYGNTISTVDNSGKRKWIYAFRPRGKFYKYRTWLSWFYILVFFGIPFIKINNKPFLMFNIPRGEFIIFGQLFFPQDFIILGIGMMIAIVFIIVFTLLFGRIFCGWICPQTIFLEMVFRKIEFWIEGPAHKQMAMAKKADKPTDYYVKKVLKHVLFFVLSFLIANTFLAYIIGVDDLWGIIRGPISENWVGLLSILAFTAVFYFIYAYVREIVCTVICPYGRMQSTLMDKKSMAVAYDFNRGEPRAKGNKRKVMENAGDCIDCGMCVNVCPTGIDIRNGLQMECVNCTACIDACDMMMRKVNKPEKLITFASEHQLETNTVGKSKLDLRAKFLLVLLIVLSLFFVSGLVMRPFFDTTVMRVPGQLYQENKDGTVTNLYKLKVLSKAPNTRPFQIALKDKQGKIEYVGRKIDSLQSGQQGEEIFFIRLSPEQISNRKMNLHIQIKSDDKVIDTKKVSFLSSY